jgi:hypothetical protein
VMYSYNRSQHDALFLNFIFVNNSICFGQTYCPSSGVLILYSQQLVFVILVMSYVDSQLARSEWNIVHLVGFYYKGYLL